MIIICESNIVQKVNETLAVLTMRCITGLYIYYGLIAFRGVIRADIDAIEVTPRLQRGLK